MSLLGRLRSALGPSWEEPSRGFVWPYTDYGGYGGDGPYRDPLYLSTSSSSGQYGIDKEAPRTGFRQLVDMGWRSNSTVFACEQKRISIFAEARFVWRKFNQGRPGQIWSDANLDILETPWPHATTSDLLAEILVMADLGGNGFVSRLGGEEDRLRVWRPDWTTIVMGDSAGRPVESPGQLDCEIIGFIYDPQDGQTGPVAALAEEVAHFVPPGLRDPLSRFRGMSWLTPIIRELQSDNAATLHKLQFFTQGATPQMVVKFDTDVSQDAFQAFVHKMDDSHSGWRNAYKTIYLGGGADVSVVGKDLQQLDFSNTQGHGETRIATASGLHPVLVGLSESLKGSSLNAGNYALARRVTADTCFQKTLAPGGTCTVTITVSIGPGAVMGGNACDLTVWKGLVGNSATLTVKTLP